MRPPKDVAGYSVNREVDIEKAKGEGFIVLTPTSHQLFLDLDTTDAYDRYRALRRIAASLYGFVETAWWFSKSGVGRHVVLEATDAMPIIPRIALQASLGSDPIKEMFSLWRVHAGIIEPILLFQPGNAEVHPGEDT